MNLRFSLDPFNTFLLIVIACGVLWCYVRGTRAGALFFAVLSFTWLVMLFITALYLRRGEVPPGMTREFCQFATGTCEEDVGDCVDFDFFMAHKLLATPMMFMMATVQSLCLAGSAMAWIRWSNVREREASGFTDTRPRE